MKKHHSPRGKRSALRLLAYTFAAVAILSAREVIIHKDGTVAKKLGNFSDSLKTRAELPFGLDRSKGMTADIPLPKGMTRNGEDTSMAGKSRKVISQASQEAFVAATRVDLDTK